MIILFFPVGPCLLWDGIHLIISTELTKESLYFLGYAGSLYYSALYGVSLSFSFIYTFSQKNLLNAYYVLGLLMGTEDVFACFQVVLSLREIYNYKNEFRVIFVIQPFIQQTFKMSIISQTLWE